MTTLKQVSVYVENKTGRLRDITTILSEAGLNLIAHALMGTSDFGVLRMIVDAPDRAVAVLRTAGFVVNVNTVVGMLVEDRPGGFNRLLNLLGDAGIGFNYTYSIGHLPGRQAVNIIHFDDPAAAVAVLEKGGVAVVGQETVSSYW